METVCEPTSSVGSVPCPGDDTQHPRNPVEIIGSGEDASWRKLTSGERLAILSLLISGRRRMLKLQDDQEEHYRRLTTQQTSVCSLHLKRGCSQSAVALYGRDGVGSTEEEVDA